MIINTKIITNAPANEISSRMADGTIKIKIKEKPFAGKANQALIEFLSNEFKVSKRDVQIISGLKSRKKRIEIGGLTLEQLEQKF